MKLNDLITKNKKAIYLLFVIVLAAAIGLYLFSKCDRGTKELKIISIEVAGGGNVYTIHKYNK